MKKYVIEDKINDVKTEDGGCAKIVTLYNEDDRELFVRLQSWSEDCKHVEFNNFVGKRVRVYI